LQTMATTLEIHFLTLKYTHCQFCQNYPKKVAKIKLILAKLAFATNYEANIISIFIIINKLIISWPYNKMWIWFWHVAICEGQLCDDMWQ
jgi:hypothetical protein